MSLPTDTDPERERSKPGEPDALLGAAAGQHGDGEDAADRAEAASPPSSGGGEPAGEPSGAVTVLGQLGIDLLEMSGLRGALANGDLWKPELTRIKETLERRERRSTILVGPDGVGKRALVVALAREIADGRVPRHLLGRRVIELPFHAVLANVREPADFERIVFTALREAGSSDVVLFLSQITSFMGITGGQTGLLGAANAIEMGCHHPNLYLVGSATRELYREAAAALPWCWDLLTRVDVPEPSRDATAGLLREVTEGLAEYHGVRIGDEAIAAAVDLSSNYIQDRVLPGKAYELLDHAASKLATATGGRPGNPSVEREHVAQALSDRVGIPAAKLAERGHPELLGLEEALARRIKGQDRCVRKLADVIRVTKLGLDARPLRPNGVFLFVGPAGVGKTELVRVLANELYGGTSRLFEFNMARYSDEDSVARLVGLSAGDVDYPGDLATSVGRHPHCVVVFEHIERSHRDVAVMLMQIFRDGYVIDGHGSKLHFSNSTVVLTTSADSLVPGSDENGAVGFTLSDRDRDEHNLREAKEAIEAFFPADFMDGIDEVLLFDPLSEQALREIVHVHLDDIRARLASRSISLDVADEAVTKVVEKGHSREYGARNLGRTVESMFLKPLAKFLLANPNARKLTVRVVEGDIEVGEGT